MLPRGREPGSALPRVISRTTINVARAPACNWWDSAANFAIFLMVWWMSECPPLLMLMLMATIRPAQGADPEQDGTDMEPDHLAALSRLLVLYGAGHVSRVLNRLRNSTREALATSEPQPLSLIHI